MTSSTAPGDDVAARYARPSGGRRGRLVGRVLAVVGALLAVLVLVSLTRAFVTPDTRWRDIAFTVVDDSRVEVTFEVYASPGDVIRCQVRASDTRFVDVGQVDVDLGPLTGNGERRTVSIRTVAPAVSASVRSCVLLPQGLS